MVRDQRLNLGALSLLLGLGALGSADCARSVDVEKRTVQRRPQQQPTVGQGAQTTRSPKTQLTNEQGDLIRSDVKVAGIQLPRGFELSFTFNHEWYYDGPLPMNKLETYFNETLERGTIEKPDPYSIIYAAARTKGEPRSSTAMVRIFPMSARPDFSRIHIEAPKPAAEATRHPTFDNL